LSLLPSEGPPSNSTASVTTLYCGVGAGSCDSAGSAVAKKAAQTTFMEKQAIFITDPIADYPLPESLLPQLAIRGTGEPVVHNVFAALQVPRLPP